MPETKLENVFFTLITSGLMIFLMGVYNVAIHTGGLRYSTFIYAAHSFRLNGLSGFCSHFLLPEGLQSGSLSRWRSRRTEQFLLFFAYKPLPSVLWCR